MALTSMQQYFTKIYLASFKRAPDLGGLNYWSDEVLLHGKSLQTVGGTIFSLPTILEIYPASLSDSEFVQAIYENVFGRASDDEGMIYWTNEIASLRSTFTTQGSTNAIYEARGQLAMNMIEAGLGTPDGTDGKAYIVNRLNVAEYAVERQLATDVEIPPAELLSIESNVDEDASTMGGAMDAVDGWVYDIIAPTQMAIVAVAMDDIGSTTGDVVNNGFTDDADPGLKGTLSAALAVGEKLAVYRDNQQVGDAIVTDTTWIYADSSLTLGWHSFYVRVVDQVGNQGVISPFFRINIVAPAVPVDTTPPTLQTAAINGAVLTLTYSEELNAASNALASSFVVNVAGNSVEVNSVDTNGPTVSLTLASAVLNGQVVNVSYTPPVTNPTEDLAGNDAAALSEYDVANDTPPVQGDTTPPVLESAVYNRELGTVVLTYSENLQESSEPRPVNFSVDSGRLISVNSVDVSGKSVVLILNDSIREDSTVSVSYTPPSDSPLKDVAGNLASALSSQAVTPWTATHDIVKPSIVSAEFNLSNNILTVTYSEILNPQSEPSASGLSLRDETEIGSTDSSSPYDVWFDGDQIIMAFRNTPVTQGISEGHSTSFAYANYGSFPPFIEDMSGNSADFIYPGQYLISVVGSLSSLPDFA